MTRPKCPVCDKVLYGFNQTNERKTRWMTQPHS